MQDRTSVLGRRWLLHGVLLAGGRRDHRDVPDRLRRLRRDPAGGDLDAWLLRNNLK